MMFVVFLLHLAASLHHSKFFNFTLLPGLCFAFVAHAHDYPVQSISYCRSPLASCNFPSGRVHVASQQLGNHFAAMYHTMLHCRLATIWMLVTDKPYHGTQIALPIMPEPLACTALTQDTAMQCYGSMKKQDKHML